MRALKGEYDQDNGRIHFWLTRTGGDPVEFVMDTFLCQFPKLGGLYDGIVMFLHVDRLRRTITIRARRYTGMLSLKDIDRDSGFVHLIDGPYGLSVIHEAEKDELTVNLRDQKYHLTFRQLVDVESI